MMSHRVLDAIPCPVPQFIDADAALNGRAGFNGPVGVKKNAEG